MTWNEDVHRFDYGVDRAWNREQAWLAEVLVATRYGLAHRSAPVGVPDKGWDLVAGKLTIDVKWSRRHDSPLYLNLTVKAGAQAYVLVTGVERKLVRGFAWRHVLLATPVIDPGFGKCHALNQASLHPNVDLLMACQGIRRQD